MLEAPVTIPKTVTWLLMPLIIFTRSPTHPFSCRGCMIYESIIKARNLIKSLLIHCNWGSDHQWTESAIIDQGKLRVHAKMCFQVIMITAWILDRKVGISIIKIRWFIISNAIKVYRCIKFVILAIILSAIQSYITKYNIFIETALGVCFIELISWK